MQHHGTLNVPAHQVHQVHQVRRDHRGRTAKKGRPDHPVHKVHRAWQATKDRKVLKAHLDQRESPVLRVRPALWALRDQLGRPDRRGKQVHPARSDRLDLREQRAKLDLSDRRVHLDRLDRKVSPAILEQCCARLRSSAALRDGAWQDAGMTNTS